MEVPGIQTSTAVSRCNVATCVVGFQRRHLGVDAISTKVVQLDVA